MAIPKTLAPEKGELDLVIDEDNGEGMTDLLQAAEEEEDEEVQAVTSRPTHSVRLNRLHNLLAIASLNQTFVIRSVSSESSSSEPPGAPFKAGAVWERALWLNLSNLSDKEKAAEGTVLAGCHRHLWQKCKL